MGIEVRSEVEVYELDGAETVLNDKPALSVLSHWNRSSMVVIHVGDKSSTVVAAHLRAAIDNATNTGG
jgi:hypothetical protein